MLQHVDFYGPRSQRRWIEHGEPQSIPHLQLAGHSNTNGQGRGEDGRLGHPEGDLLFRAAGVDRDMQNRVGPERPVSPEGPDLRVKGEREGLHDQRRTEAHQSPYHR